jgi:hypothetical protein
MPDSALPCVTRPLAPHMPAPICSCRVSRRFRQEAPFPGTTLGHTRPLACHLVPLRIHHAQGSSPPASLDTPGQHRLRLNVRHGSICFPGQVRDGGRCRLPAWSRLMARSSRHPATPGIVCIALGASSRRLSVWPELTIKSAFLLLEGFNMTVNLTYKASLPLQWTWQRQ